MKNCTFKKQVQIGIAIVILGFLWATFFGGAGNYLKDISEEVGIDIEWGEVVSEADTHGGFHGDGTKITVLQFTETLLEERMEENEKWHAFPLPSELETVVYGKTEGNSTTGPYIGYGSAGIEIPEITNGYYYFKDRHSESTNPYDSTGILGRHSYNFTILIYDCDTDLLYICEEDT